MMNENNELTFEQVLTSLFENENLPIHLIYRLSDLSPYEIAEFRKTWPTVGRERRVSITRHMVDISEESYLVNFDTVSRSLFEDEDAAVRLAALDVVWDSTDTSLIPSILGILQHDVDPDVRAGAARALAHYVLLGEWGELDVIHTEPIVKVLMDEYERPDTSIQVKRAALEAMAPAGKSRIEDFITDAYESGPFELQLSAVFAMGNTADSRWLSILEDEFENSSSEMRAEAARAAGAIGDSQIIDALQQLLVDEDIDVTLTAIHSLGQIGGERAMQILSNLSEDPDFEEFYDVIDEALDNMDWMAGEFDLLAYSQDEDDDLLDELRLN
jgi:HEAT repeat protein